MELQLTEDRILIFPNIPIDKTSSGVILPENAREDEKIGKVVSVGPKVKEVAVGDSVAFQKNRSASVEIDGKKYWTCREWQIYGIIEE